MTWELFFDVLKEALSDSAKVLPVVFAVYVLIEIIEAHQTSKRTLERAFSNKAAPLFGALIGVIPQCGLSVVATKLYQGKYVLLGTLIAVYFATSDEAIPILFSHAINDPSVLSKIGLLLLIKVSFAIAVGFIINAMLKNTKLAAFDGTASEVCQEECDHDHHDGESHDHGDSCEKEDENEPFKELIIHPFIHSLKVIGYIFIVNLLFGILIEGIVGVDRLAAVLNSSVFLQPLFSSVIGLIPNCASSVIITELFAEGVLSLGGAVAGLTVNSGLGVAVLLKDKKNIKKNLGIIGLAFGLSLVIGYLVTVIELLI